MITGKFIDGTITTETYTDNNNINTTCINTNITSLQQSNTEAVFSPYKPKTIKKILFLFDF